MTGFKSKKKARHADDITLDHLIELRKENEKLRKSLSSAHDNLEGLVRDVYAAYANTKLALKGDE